MSDTKVDLAKVTQMLDAGWEVLLWKLSRHRYVAQGRHKEEGVWRRARERCLDSASTSKVRELMEEVDWDEVGEVHTDDFTPEQALTRLAYKVHGEVI